MKADDIRKNAFCMPFSSPAYPRGPYRLGGYSIGSTIAYEMARQLEAAGERVPQLMLVADPIDGSSWWWSTVRRAVALIGGLLGQDEAAMLDRFSVWGKYGELAAGMFSRGGAARIREGFRRTFARANREGSLSGFVPSAAEIDDTLKALLWAAADYRPGTYRGRVTLIEAKHRFFSRNASGFKRRVPLAEQVHLPYDHDSIVTTHAADLGAALGRLLCAHDARSGPV